MLTLQKPVTTLIDCPHCKGRGRIELTGIYAETLALIKQEFQADYVVANQQHELFGCNPTALNNRLKYLERNGFLRSETYGREKRYRIRDQT